MPRAIAAIGGVLSAFAIIFGLGSLIATQLNRLAGDLLCYQTTIENTIQSVRSFTGGSATLERAAGMLHDLSKEIARPKATPSGRRSNPGIAKFGKEPQGHLELE